MTFIMMITTTLLSNTCWYQSCICKNTITITMIMIMITSWYESCICENYSSDQIFQVGKHCEADQTNLVTTMIIMMMIVMIMMMVVMMIVIMLVM